MDTRRARGDRGLALPLLALLMSTLVVMVATAIDLGRQRADRRLAQSGADAVALDMIRLVEGRTLDEVVSDPDTVIALSESADRNDFGNAVGSVVDAHTPRITNIEWGELGDDEDGSSFVLLSPVVGVDTDLDGTDDLDEVPTAVRITAERTTDYFFQPGEKGVTRLAIATEDKTASFRLGSRLASVDAADSALLDRVLGRALRGPAAPAPPDVDVSFLDYDGLLGADVEIGRLAAALGAGSPDELAGSTIDGPRFFDATADALEAQGDTANATAFRAVGAQLDSSTQVQWDQIFDIQQGGSGGVAEGTVNAFGLLQATAYAINGNRTIDVPSVALDGGLLGLAEVQDLTVTERPIVVAGREGASGTTRQANTRLTYTVDDRPLGPLLRFSGTITVDLQAAGADGVLSDIDCGRPGIDVAMTPRPVAASVSVDLIVRSLGLPVARASGVTASYDPQGSSNGASFLFPAEFLPTVGTGSMEPASSTSLGLAGASTITVGRLTLLGVLPLGTTLDDVASLLESTVDPLLALVDDRISTRLDRQLGLHLGGADIGALNMTCRSVKLVG